MADKKNIYAVGLLMMTQNPESGELIAVLQVRGDFNFEKNKPESFSGGYQLTVHGKREGGEESMETLAREMKEELKVDIAEIKKLKKGIKLLNREITEKGEIINYGVIVPESIIDSIELHPSSGGLKFTKKEELNKVQNLENYRGGVPEGVVAMFEDQKEATHIAFENLR